MLHNETLLSHLRRDHETHHLKHKIAHVSEQMRRLFELG
jgi:hypothetical protein